MLRTITIFVLSLVAAGPALAQDPGQVVFLTNCSACHQATGLGIKGAFPALAGDPFVRGDPAAVVAVVLKGRGGMPPFTVSLADDQIAAAVSYVRKAWGNDAAPVTAAEVAAVKAASGLQSH